MKCLITTAVLLTILAVTHSQDQNSVKQDPVAENTPPESDSEKIDQHVSNKVRGAIVAFKQRNRHLSGGALLTTSHVIAPASYLTELKKPNFANVSVYAGVFFNLPDQEYKIAQIDFDRKSYRPHSDMKLDDFAIVTLEQEVKKSEYVSTIIVSRNWYSNAIPAVSIGLDEGLQYEETYIANPYKRAYDIYLHARGNFISNELILGSLLIANYELVGIATSPSAGAVRFLDLSHTFLAIRRWLWEHKGSASMEDWISKDITDELFPPNNKKKETLWKGGDRDQRGNQKITTDPSNTPRN